MATPKLMSETVTKINRILGGLVNCEFEFKPEESLDASEWMALDLLRAGDVTAPSYVESESSGSIGFPIRLRGRFAGLAVIKGSQGERPTQILSLAEILTVVLESALAREERGDRLTVLEERVRTLSEGSNVIPFRQRGQEDEEEIDVSALEAIEIDAEPYGSNREPSPLVTTPILVETSPAFPLERVAVEIHQQSSRWAMLGLRDLPADVLSSRDGLKELGGITIFIRDLTELTTEQQTHLAEYLATKPSEDMPQVIAGICEGQASAILPRLRELFCVSRINMAGKTTSQVNKELIDASIAHIMERSRAQVSLESGKFLPFNAKLLDPDRIH